MEQHPIPQNISSYEFKLVGEMTLRQFLKAAGGLALAFLVNSTGIVFLVRWPLVFLFGAGGLALAFLPFRDRPLERWILSFWRSIYAPTIYIYKKAVDRSWMDWQSKIKEVEVEEDVEEDIMIKKQKKNRIKEYIQSLPSVKKEEGIKVKKGDEKKESMVKSKEELKGVENGVRQEAGAGGNGVEAKTDWREKKANLDLKKETLEATGEAVFGSIPMPSIPETPNLVVGMVTDNLGKIMEDVIVEIQDEKGNPARVLKTNSLGQFRTSTQLADGKYLIITEKEGNDFSRVNINLTGRIVQPVKIRATA